jgi:hypothetical protein
MKRFISILTFTGCALALGCSSGDPSPPVSPHAGAPPPSTAAAVASAAFTAVASAASASAPADPPRIAAASASPAPVAPPPVLPDGLRVLLIGDSFAEALGSGMRQVKDDFHVKVIARGEHSTFIPQWAGIKFGVPLILLQEKPDVVVIALGGNELAMADPSIRTPDIEKIVGFMGGIPCVWVGTPSFGKENDLPAIIRKHSSPCRFYDSNALSPNLPRGSDKIHPTSDGQKMWAGQVLSWLASQRDGGKTAFALSPRPEAE